MLDVEGDDWDWLGGQGSVESMCVGVEDGGIGMELWVEDVDGDIEEDGAGVCFVEAVVGDFGKVFLLCKVGRVKIKFIYEFGYLIFFKPIDVALGDVAGFGVFDWMLVVKIVMCYCCGWGKNWLYFGGKNDIEISEFMVAFVMYVGNARVTLCFLPRK